MSKPTSAAIVLALLAACGAPSAQIHTVSDPALAAIVSELRGNLSQALGYDALPMVDEGGMELVFDTSHLNTYAMETDVLVAGLTDYVAERIYLVSVGETVHSASHGTFTMAENFLPLAVAHEIGHALGLHHSKSGIMAPGSGVWACFNKEALCLRDALAEQHGKLN